MKKIVHDLSPLVCFLFTAAVMTLIAFQLVIFLQRILEATPGHQLMRSGF
jgi:hypothetical protein